MLGVSGWCNEFYQILSIVWQNCTHLMCSKIPAFKMSCIHHAACLLLFGVYPEAHDDPRLQRCSPRVHWLQCLPKYPILQCTDTLMVVHNEYLSLRIELDHLSGKYS